MWDVLNPLRELNILTVVVRMALSVICGGIVGFERSYKRRPAGFRTHFLVCFGACITMLTSQYLALTMQYPTDIARLGAQVIAGVGFIGAGTIIVTHRRRIKGLTTAAGLWTTAIIGLAIGASYYEAAVCTTVLVILAESVFSSIEYRLMRRFQDMYLYVEYNDGDTLDEVMAMLRKYDIVINDIEIALGETEGRCAVFTVKGGRRKLLPGAILTEIASVQGVLAVEKL